MASTEQQPAAAPAAETNGAGARTIPVENPATGEIIAQVPVVEPGDVAAIAARARAAQPAWEALGFEGRSRVLLRAQKWVIDNSDRLIDTVVSETGKTYEDAQVGDIAMMVAGLGFWPKFGPGYLADEKIRSASPFVAGRKLLLRYAPVGVVGVIGPWNYPLSNSTGDCIPALLAGNSVLLKPSEVTPLTSQVMLAGLKECGLPDDVMHVLAGYGETAAEMIDHVDMVMFTGSTATGKKVMERASKTLTPVSLELGGKDPMIVCSDAELERASNAAVHYAMQNGGQTCISVERVYVEAPVYDEFVNKVTQKARALRQGKPGEPGTVDVGAVTFGKQIDIVESHVEDAKQKGAKVLVGGHAKREGGRFYEPTVLVDVDHTMKAMTDETFGPTLPIMKVADVEEAVRLSNDSPYGLGASVWTRDAAKGEAIARRIEAGSVSVNDAQLFYAAQELPMGGWKSSGVGSRHGAGGIRKYCRQQAITVNRFAPMKKDLHMLPYSARTTKLLGRVLKLVYGRGKRT